MSFIKVQNLSKSYGINTVFSDVNFEIRKGEKIGIVGDNGAGKTTLFRCLTKLESPDTGQIIYNGSITGYMEQINSFTCSTLYEELCEGFQDILHLQEKMRYLEIKISEEADDEKLLEEYSKAIEEFERKNGYEYESTLKKVAFGLKFTDEDFDRNPEEFSGGQKTRISLAKSLLRNPDFIFLDEPTNHLDLNMIEWLEDFLLKYSGAVIIISHDRYFLDKVTTRILEVENKKITDYKGNYSRYMKQKEENLKAQERAYIKQEEFVDKEEAYIEKYRAGIKSKQARGRQSKLGRLERLEKPFESKSFDFFSFNVLSESAERVLELKEVALAYGENSVFKDVSFSIRKENKTALIGDNGAGKSSLLKIIAGQLNPKKGIVKLGNRVKIGYFAQELEGLNSANSVIDEIIFNFAFGEEQARNYLGHFHFRGDDVFKKIDALSGGEKARVALLKLMLAESNFLIMDEPTNHLDIRAREALEEAILAFPGTFLIVSHDRYFLDKVANKIMELEYGKLKEYEGNYTYFKYKKDEFLKELEKSKTNEKIAEDKKEIKQKLNNKPAKKSRPIDIKRLEAEIAQLEFEKKSLEILLNSPETHADLEQSKKIAEEYSDFEKKLAEKYDLWFEVTEQENS